MVKDMVKDINIEHNCLLYDLFHTKELNLVPLIKFLHRSQSFHGASLHPLSVSTIDIFEVFGKANKKENQRAYYAAVHRYQTPYVESLVNKKKYKLENRYTRLEVPYDFYEDFHIYGLLWTPDELVWFLDGEEVFRRKNDFFKRPLHVIFDAEIMETWDGLPNVDDLPSTFEVDYIRVWRPN